jgi:6-phosphogluconate dehydrogenase
MKLAMIGLGKMGANMVRRLVRDGHEVIAYSKSSATALALSKELNNVNAVSDLAELIENLTPPRIIWLMVPHQFVDETI